MKEKIKIIIPMIMIAFGACMLMHIKGGGIDLPTIMYTSMVAMGIGYLLYKDN